MNWNKLDKNESEWNKRIQSLDSNHFNIKSLCGEERSIGIPKIKTSVSFLFKSSLFKDEIKSNETGLLHHNTSESGFHD